MSVSTLAPTSEMVRQFIRFAGVGAAGFAVDLAVTLAAAPVFGAGPGRIFAVAVAVTVTFALNRHLTFRSRRRSMAAQGLRYVGVSAAGATVNFFFYWIYLTIFPGISPTFIVQAVVIGSGAAMFVNFLGSRLVAFDE